MSDRPTEGMRLDKWLWVARFFKTRNLASEAIVGGKVHLNGQRTKPGKEVRVGTRLRVRRGPMEWELIVQGIASQRRPASEASLLYEETDESRRRREEQAEQRRLAADARPHSGGRPTKKDRRLINRFSEKRR